MALGSTPYAHVNVMPPDTIGEQGGNLTNNLLAIIAYQLFIGAPWQLPIPHPILSGEILAICMPMYEA